MLPFTDFTFVAGHQCGRNMGQTHDSRHVISETSRWWQRRFTVVSGEKWSRAHPARASSSYVLVFPAVSHRCLLRVTLDPADHLPFLTKVPASCVLHTGDLRAIGQHHVPDLEPASSALSASRDNEGLIEEGPKLSAPTACPLFKGSFSNRLFFPTLDNRRCH